MDRKGGGGDMIAHRPSYTDWDPPPSPKPIRGLVPREEGMPSSQPSELRIEYQDMLIFPSVVFPISCSFLQLATEIWRHHISRGVIHHQ